MLLRGFHAGTTLGRRFSGLDRRVRDRISGHDACDHHLHSRPSGGQSGAVHSPVCGLHGGVFLADVYRDLHAVLGRKCVDSDQLHSPHSSLPGDLCAVFAGVAE